MHALKLDYLKATHICDLFDFDMDCKLNGEKDGEFFIGESFGYVFVSLAGRSSGADKGW